MRAGYDCTQLRERLVSALLVQGVLLPVLIKISDECIASSSAIYSELRSQGCHLISSSLSCLGSEFFALQFLILH